MTDQLADPELAAFLKDFYARGVPPAAELGADAMRAGAAERAAAKPPGPQLSVSDLTAGPGGRPARLYRPAGAAPALMLFLHGGGFVIGDLDTHDRACRRLADRSRVPVLALDYRRAPEHPWPAAVDDVVAALRWIASRPAVLELPADAAVAVGGDSAGGTLGALACLRLRGEDPAAAPALQLLAYANTDLASSGGSMLGEGHGFGLEAADVEWYNAQWVPDPALRTDPRVSPLREPDLARLPAAVVITCEHDPLRDQGEAYAGRLRAAGVPVRARREPGMVHNFLLWDTVSPACAAAGDRVADDLAAALRRD
ncbi:MAG TPA: alpha/beta hydrolase [Streptosporangiaceae bacterium]|jgi:acetyl esterase|nr:alpha/beta hydrolase [Streptosporangiaceae bacterium]